jgi:hypothetical protein
MSNWEVDELFRYQGYHQMPAYCWLNIVRFGRGLHKQRSAVIVLTELPDSGTSVTNRIESLAGEVWQRVLRRWQVDGKIAPISPGRALWFEHYLSRGHNFPEHYDLVTFDWNDRTEASRAVWHRVDEKFIEQLTRFPLNLSHIEELWEPNRQFLVCKN